MKSNLWSFLFSFHVRHDLYKILCPYVPQLLRFAHWALFHSSEHTVRVRPKSTVCLRPCRKLSTDRARKLGLAVFWLCLKETTPVGVAKNLSLEDLAEIMPDVATSLQVVLPISQALRNLFVFQVQNTSPFWIFEFLNFWIFIFLIFQFLKFSILIFEFLNFSI